LLPQQRQKKIDKLNDDSLVKGLGKEADISLGQFYKMLMVKYSNTQKNENIWVVII